VLLAAPSVLPVSHSSRMAREPKLIPLLSEYNQLLRIEYVQFDHEQLGPPEGRLLTLAGSSSLASPSTPVARVSRTAPPAPSSTRPNWLKNRESFSRRYQQKKCMVVFIESAVPAVDGI
jgi:hypothetical protein